MPRGESLLITSSINTSRPGSRNGSGRNKTAFTTAKIAELAPMPNAERGQSKASKDSLPEEYPNGIPQVVKRIAHERTNRQSCDHRTGVCLQRAGRKACPFSGLAVRSESGRLEIIWREARSSGMASFQASGFESIAAADILS